MPFHQGRRSCLVLAEPEYRRFCDTLLQLGYRPHTGLRTERRGDFAAWVAPLGRARQVHVQCARGRGRTVEVYAHTEPAGSSLAHALAAVLDLADFRRGGRLLLRQLRQEGWNVDRR